LHALGLVLQRALGGTSGPLYAVFLLRAAATLRSGPIDDPATWATAFRRGVEGIAQIGGAAVGDRAMLDALVPASKAFQTSLDAGVSFSDALQDAASVAEKRADATATLTPLRGRSSYLGQRAIGHPDPGAVAAAVWLRAVADSIGAGPVAVPPAT
jgi:dihydroxyacetone kinase